jgi:hypothetical protein
VRKESVKGRKRDVGPDRRPGIAATRTDDLVDDLSDTKATQHLPHRSDVPEGEVAGAIGLTGTGLGQAGSDLLCRAQVALGDDPGLSLHPGGLGQVVVGLPVLLLADDECHI